MKRTLCILLSLLCLSLAIPMASAAGQEVGLSAPADQAEENLYIQSIAVSGDTAYLLSANGLYIWRAGEGAAQWRFAEQGGNEILISSDDGAVYAYLQNAGALGRVSDTGIAWDVTLDPGFMSRSEDGETIYRWIESAFVMGGKLYAVVSGEAENDYRPQLASFDVATGAGARLDTGDAQLSAVVPYIEGKLLVTRWEDDGRLMAAVYDPQAQAFGETFGVIERGYAAGVSYSAAQDALYYLQNGVVMRLEHEGQPEIAAYLPQTYTQSGTLLADGRYAAVLQDSLFVASLDPADLPERILTVQGSVNDEALRRFHQMYPDVPVIPAEAYYDSAEGVAQAITGGDTGIDVFSLSLAGGMRALIDKGYALDLSSSEKITAYMDSLYPQFSAAVSTREGKPAAVYSYVGTDGLLAIDTDLWARFDLGEYPKTLEELIDLMLLWEEKYQQENPDLALYGYYGSHTQLVHLAIDNHILQSSRAGQKVDFSDPAFRSVLQKIAQMPKVAFDWDRMSESEQEEANRYYSRVFIISEGSAPFSEGTASWQSEDGGKLHIMPVPPLEAGDEGAFSLYGEVMFVNPLSQNADLAIAYLECMLSSLGPEVERTLSPASDEPVRIEGFDVIVADMQEGLEQAKQLREAASEVDKPDYDALIRYYETWLANTEENQWRITQEGIRRWRELAPLGVLEGEIPLLSYEGGARQIYELADRYDAGQLDLDAFLRELNQKATMIQLEGG